MENLVDLLISNDLDIDKDAEDFVSLFVNTAGYKTEPTKNRILLPSWYDGYFFCIWIGLKFNRRKKEWNKITKSNRGFSTRKSQYFYLIASLLSKEEILFELNIESRESINDKNINPEKLSKQIKYILDSYCFGGIEVLKEMYDEDEGIFDDPEYLSKIISQYTSINP